MAGYEKCIARLNQAAGRDMTDKEVAAVFARIHKASLDIKAGRVDIQDVGVGQKLGKVVGNTDETNALIQRAADVAVAELKAEAAAHERRAALAVLAQQARNDDYQTLKTSVKDPLTAVKMMAYRNYKGTNIESMEQRIAGVTAKLQSELSTVWDALGKDLGGFFQDKQKELIFLRELLGESTGDTLAKKAAELYRATGERARLWANEVGFDIGHLENYAFPQHTGQVKAADANLIVNGVRSKDVDVNRAAFVERTFPRIKKDAYIDKVTGEQMSDQEIKDFLGKAWDTISTNGVSNMVPGQHKGTGMLAKRHSEHRSIHFKDAESAIDHWKDFGDQSLLDILYGHIDVMGRDIGMAGYWGPNDRATWQTILDQATIDAVEADRIHTEQIQADARSLNTKYEYSTRGSKPSSNPAFSAVMDGISHLNTAGKGGMFALSSLFGDRVMFEAVSMMSNIPFFQRWSRQASLLNPANAQDRRALQRNGLMLDVIRSDLNRFYSDFNTTSQFSAFTGKIANVVMRVTGMRAINEIPKAALGSLFFDAIGREVSAGKAFKDLAESDVRLLRNYGITAEDWKVWSLVDRVTEGPFERTAITPEGISQITDIALRDAGLISPADGPDVATRVRRDATVKLLGAVNSETEFGIVTPGMYEKAQFYSTLQRGTKLGEIGHAVLQFKSFPWAQLMRILDVLDNQEGYVSKAVVGSALIAALTMTGAMILQTKELLGGKDPRKMFPDGNYDKFKFWGAAVLQGGALGIYGDFFSSINTTRYNTGPLEALAGPTVGTVAGLLPQALTAVKGGIEGKQTHFGAQATQAAKGFVPMGNAWYLKTALDHMVWQRVMEQLSPGYLTTIRQKTLKEYGQDSWWRPGEMSPDRAPEFSLR